jgi:hypothetical protein
MPIGQFRDLQVNVLATSLPETKPQPTPTAHSKNQPKAGVAALRPAPPSLIQATPFDIRGIPEAPRILESLTKLNDSDTLTRTRQVSNFFDSSVVRWVNKRNVLAFNNVLASRCTRNELEITHKGKRESEFVPALTEEALLSCLTVNDVRELAHFEQPQSSNHIELGGRIMPLIDLAPGSLPRGTFEPYTATFAAQALLFFVVVYFGAFCREAVASPAFPVRGTLFGAFSKSRLTLLVLFVALLIPLGTSVAVAASARKWTFGVCVPFIAWAVLSVYAVLQRKSYFRALYSRVTS